METPVNKELLCTYFAGRATAFQKQLIEEWAKNNANRELFYSYLEEWEKQNPQYLAEVTSAMERHQARLAGERFERPADTSLNSLPAPSFWRRWPVWLIAASVACIAPTGWFLRDHILFKTIETAYGQTRQLTLSDGSKVTLNANSRLTIPRFGFGSQTRSVELMGEATFAVTHTASNQLFVVKTGQRFDVVVLGTEFTVYNRARGGKVVLNKGKVQLRYEEGRKRRELIMKPGDLVTLDNQNHIAVKTTKNPQPTWSQNRFVFDEMPLQELAYLLEENYGFQVEIKNPELAQRVLMGSFQADNVDQLLQSISELLDIDVVRQGDHVQLKEY